MNANGSNPQPPPAQNSFVNPHPDGLQTSQVGVDQQGYYRSANPPFTLYLPHGSHVNSFRKPGGHMLVEANFPSNPTPYSHPYINNPNQFYMPSQQGHIFMGQQYVNPIQQGYNLQQLQASYLQQSQYSQQQVQQPPTSTVSTTALKLNSFPVSSPPIVPIIGNVAPVTSTAITPVADSLVTQQPAKNTRAKRVLKITHPETQKCLNESDVANSELNVSDTVSESISDNSSKNIDLKDTANKLEDEKTAEIQRNFTAAVAAAAIEKASTTQANVAEIEKASTTQANITEIEKTSTTQVTTIDKNGSKKAVPEKIPLMTKVTLISKEVDSTLKTELDAEKALSNRLHEKLNIENPKITATLPFINYRELSVEESTIPSVTIENGNNDLPRQENPEVVSPIIDDSECNGKLVDEPCIRNGIGETIEAKVKHYEDKMTKYLEEPGTTDVAALIYNSQFLRLMRNIVRELRHVKCPKTEAELKEMGIDKAGMPVSTINKKPKFGSSTDRFLPFYIQPPSNTTRLVGTRPNYGGRHSDNKTRDRKLPIGRLSIDRVSRKTTDNILHRKAANAWRPSRDTVSTDAANVEKIRYDKIKKEVRGLLNKITPSTYETLADEFCNRNVYEDELLLPMIIDLIFDKAVEEPHFCPLYSDLCQKQVESEPKTASTDQITFRKSIIQKCQATFLGSNSYDEQIQNCEKELNDETTEAVKKAELREKIDFLKSKEKRRLNGIIRFVAELYRHNLLINSIINWCVVELVQKYDSSNDDVYIEYAVNMIERVGKTYEKKKLQNPSDEMAIEKIISHLSVIKGNLTNRVRFMIMNLEELKRSDWMPRHGKQGPKTMEEVRNEAEQEQLENQQEREAYERKVTFRDHNNSAKKGSKSAYLGRSSMDNRPDKRAAAGLASLTSSTLKKDTDLKKFEDQVRLGPVSSRQNPWSFSKKDKGNVAQASDKCQAVPIPSSAIPLLVSKTIESKESSPTSVFVSKVEE